MTSSTTQFVFLRLDLSAFGRGSLVAQACHASVAAIYTTQDLPETKMYLTELSSMRKVILRMKEDDVDGLVDELNRSGIRYYRWIESPENVLTAIATQPFILEEFPSLKDYFFRFKLF